MWKLYNTTDTLYSSVNITEAVIIQIYSHPTSYPIPSQRETTYHTLVYNLIKIFRRKLEIKRVNNGTEGRIKAVHLGIICIGMFVESMNNHCFRKKA